MNNISEIIGGINISSTTIKTGGNEYVVGDSCKWSLRQKYIMLENAPETMSDKKLIKIVGLSVPLSFNKKVYYDDSPRKRDITSKSYEKKIIKEVKNKLKETPEHIVNCAVETYDLKRPLIWALGDLLKLIAVFIQKHKPNMRKIKVSPELGTIITHIKKNDKFFKYDSKTGTNIIDVIGTTLDTLGKSRIPQGIWNQPSLINPTFPKMDKNIKILIDKEKSKLGKSSTLREILLTILNIEKILIEHINALENFYVFLANDIKNIEKSLRYFLKNKN